MRKADRLNSYFEFFRDHPWAIVVLLLIAAVAVGLFIRKNMQEAEEAEEFRRRNR